MPTPSSPTDLDSPRRPEATKSNLLQQASTGAQNPQSGFLWRAEERLAPGQEVLVLPLIGKFKGVVRREEIIHGDLFYNVAIGSLRIEVPRDQLVALPQNAHRSDAIIALLETAINCHLTPAQRKAIIDAVSS